MSQQGRIGDGGTALPDIETLTGDIGGVVGPDATFNVNILGGADVTTTGNPGTNTITIDIAGGSTGTGQTIGAVTDDVITFALGAAAGTYEISARIAAFEATTPAGAGYRINAAVRTTGAAGVLIGVNAIDTFEEAALVACDVAILVVGNDAIVRVTGAAGLTIDWSAELNSILQT